MQCQLGDEIHRGQRKRLFSCRDCDLSIIKGEAVQRGRQAISIGEAVGECLGVGGAKWLGGIDVEAGMPPAHEVIGDFRWQDLALDHQRE